jgi:tol-pal system protein YbgF
MKQGLFRIVAAIAIIAAATTASAADKEQRQMMADIRILQEQLQLLHNLLGSVTEAIKAVNVRIDEQTNATRKGLADQKLVIDNLTNDSRVIREKLDDSSVRIGSLSQELDALRQSVQQMGTRAPTTSELLPTEATGGTAVPAGSSPAPAAMGVSPQRLWDQAYGDYTTGQYDLAVSGFDMYIKSFPKSEMADDAQLNIGNSYLNDGKNDKAIEAYDAVIRNYPGSNALPEAYYKKGLALRNLKQFDRAREAFEFVVKTYPNSDAALMARQGVTQLGKP